MSTTANPPAKTKPKEKQLLSDNLGYCSLLQCSGHKNAQELPLKDIPLVSKCATPQEVGISMLDSAGPEKFLSAIFYPFLQQGQQYPYCTLFIRLTQHL
jgi:hypothetical protein